LFSSLVTHSSFVFVTTDTDGCIFPDAVFRVA
jgi:hypothetical protein